MIDLVAARGYVMHPGDWTPSPRDERAPDLYAAWLDWVRDEYKAPPADFALGTYDQWPFAMRHAALGALRRRDPDAARDIVVAKASSEPAERRAKLIEALEEQLSDGDADFLQTLIGDRSDRVQNLARAYLSRLGRPTEEAALTAELAETMKVAATGWLSRRRRLSIEPLKPGPRETRRRELFSLVSYAGLCRVLGVTEDATFETAPIGLPHDLEALARMIATTGSDRAAHLFFTLAIEDADFPLARLLPLAPRIALKDRRAALPQILKRDEEMFETTFALIGGALGAAPLAAIVGSPSFKTLQQAFQSASGEPFEHSAANATVEMGLLRLGLLAAPEAAEALVARLTGMGFFPADPKLAPLIFNAALKPETQS
jgi:hypothetical protein